MFRPNGRVIFRLIFEQVECTTVHSTCSKILIKYKVVYDCIIYFLDQSITFSPYRTVNITRLHYEYHLISAVYENNR
jgi:hypothetical protein